MRRDALPDLAAFAAVADSRSFTRAASKLGLSPSALSHAMRALEGRLGLRLLARTTRSVATTAAGDRLLAVLRPALAEIDAELAALTDLRDKPAGTVRLTMPKHAARTVVWPMLPAFLEAHPDVDVEVNVDEGLTDIVTDRYDAGIRFGERVDKDMITVRIGPDIRSTIVAAPSYLARHPPPRSPPDLAHHQCINYRLATAGTLYGWEFEKGGRSIQVKVEGRLVFNDSDLMMTAALAGQGLACCFEDQAAPAVAAGLLVPVLADWCWTAPGYHLYHPGRRQVPPALAALIEALRHSPSRRLPKAGAAISRPPAAAPRPRRDRPPS